MQAETILAWGALAYGTALAMALVFDRDRLVRTVLMRALFWGAYVIVSLCVS
jgi:hypothetical protein